MDNKVVRENLKSHKKIVIKVGTTTLTHSTGRINFSRINKLTLAISDLVNQGKEVILVSSGAIAVGADRLSLSERPRDIVGKQAASAVGQAALMNIYEKFFGEYNQKVAQILLTKDIFDKEITITNVKNTFSKLLELGVVPIVNENDSVSIEELNISFSDNDNLSSYVACITKSDLLIILSDIDGLYNNDPNVDKSAKLIDYIENIDENILSSASGSKSTLGTGGMASKVMAAKRATNAGIDTIIASGTNPEVLFDIINGNVVGTLFKGKENNKHVDYILD